MERTERASESLLETTLDAGMARTDGSGARSRPAPDPVFEDAAAQLQSNIEREEHTANVVCLKQALAIAALAWPCFIPLDWLLSQNLLGWPFTNYLACRVAGETLILATRLCLVRAARISALGLRALDIAVFGQAAALVSWMCVHSGGLRSPYAAGIPVIMICRNAFAAQFWREAVWSNAVTALAYPFVILTAAVGDPALRGQFSDSVSFVHGLVYFALIACTGVFATMGGHARWSLRRQVFEARSIGRYRVVRKLGSGGMGEVWTADHKGLKRQVAIKILRVEGRHDPVSIRRFEREALALSELTHPNTVRLFDFGVTADGLWYYAMELLDGQDLGALVAKQGPLAPGRAVRLLLQASRALAEAHGRGIIHRDVKPENIFVTVAGGEPDVVKVLDFGIAKLAQRGSTLTDAPSAPGTPAYISPEAAAGGDTDRRSDVYSLGATLYFALTARPPFVERNPRALLSAHMNRPPRPPSELLDRALPAALEALVLRCLEKDPERRYATAAELAEALVALVPGLPRAPGNDQVDHWSTTGRTD